MSLIKIDQQKKVVDISKFTLDNQVVFNYFDNQPSDQREELLFRAIYIGTLALMEDRLASFLSSTTNQLGTELESLKMIFEMKKQLFEKSTQKGVIAENDICNFLNDYFKTKGYPEKAALSGNTTGELEKNKTGDIVCSLQTATENIIGIECKFDKSVKFGDIASKNLFLANNYDTVYSQLIETNANRGGKISIIVFDKATVDNSVLKYTENVGVIPGVGIVAIIDYLSGDYDNLFIAYDIARTYVLNATNPQGINMDVLQMIVQRIVKDTKEITAIESLVKGNIENNLEILRQIKKSILLVEFNKKVLQNFIVKGDLSKKELLEFYNAACVNTDFKAQSKELESEFNLNT